MPGLFFCPMPATLLFSSIQPSSYRKQTISSKTNIFEMMLKGGFHRPLTFIVFYAKRDNVPAQHGDRPIDRILRDLGRVAVMSGSNRTAPYHTGRFVLLTRVEERDHPRSAIHTGPQRDRNELFIADPQPGAVGASPVAATTTRG